MQKKTRAEIEQSIDLKIKELKAQEKRLESIKKELKALVIEQYQICDEKSRYWEKQQIITDRKTKKTSSVLCGYVAFNHDFIDEDSKEVVTIQRNICIREDDYWVIPDDYKFRY